MKQKFSTKLLSIILTLCMVFCMLPMAGLTSSAAITANTDVLGNILISTPEQLAAIGVDENYPRDGKYKLVNDIDLSNYGDWTPLCANVTDTAFAYNASTAFAGTLDGQGYKIIGMNIEISGYSKVSAGLFCGITGSGVVKNIAFVNCNINVSAGSEAHAGAVVGEIDGASWKDFSNIVVLDSTIKASNNNINNPVYLGSIVGKGNSLNIKGAYSNATLTGTCLATGGNDQVGIGGMIGGSWKGFVNVDNAFFDGIIADIYEDADVLYHNGILGLNWNHASYPTSASRFTNCYYNSSKLEPSTKTNGGHIDGTAITTEELNAATVASLGLSTDYWSDIDGKPTHRLTKSVNISAFSDYIPIYDAYGLNQIGKTYPLDGKYYVMNDIDLSVYSNWDPIGCDSNSFGSLEKLEIPSDTKPVNVVTELRYFRGVFNGGGHTISNLNISKSGGHLFAGLFGATFDAQISDFIMDNANIELSVSQRGLAGVVAGVAASNDTDNPFKSTIQNVAVTNSTVYVKSSQPKNISAAAGVVGYVHKVNVKNCSVDAALSAEYTNATAGESQQLAVGGIIGASYKSTINVENSLFIGTLNSKFYTDGYTEMVTKSDETYRNWRQNSVFGANSHGMDKDTNETTNSAKVTNCYALDTVVTNTSNLRGLDANNAITAEALATATAEELGLDGNYWKNDGNGLYLAVRPLTVNENGAIEIATAEELALIGSSTYYPLNFDYVLTADIDLASYENWTPIAPFSANGNMDQAKYADYWFTGTFNGNGHKISNMTINYEGANCFIGLFGVVSGATIENLVIDNANIDVTSTSVAYAGIVVGATRNNAKVNNIAIYKSAVNASGDQIENPTGVGGIIGLSITTNVSNVYIEADISAEYTGTTESHQMAVGGITGLAYAGNISVKDSIFAGTLNNSYYSENYDAGATVAYCYQGGIMGANSASINPTNENFENRNNIGNAWFEDVYYISDSVEVSTDIPRTLNGTETDLDNLSKTIVQQLGFNTKYWIHNGTAPTLRLSGDTEFIEGDVNGDDKVNVRDLVRIKKYIADDTTEICFIAGDYKRDKVLDATDGIYMRKAVLGLALTQNIELANASDSVKYLGRTRSENEVAVMDWSNSGFEFNGIMSGDVTATLKHSTSGDYNYGRIAVTVDGGEPEYINITNEKATYDIATNLSYGTHNIEVVKISERSKGTIYGYDVSIFGEIGERPADKDMLIEFYGDSITAGDGVVVTSRDTGDSYTDGQYANLTYAAKTADALDFDIRVGARSGIKTYQAVDELITNSRWDYVNNRVADVVVINLGTNDKSVVYDDGNGTNTGAATESGIANEKTYIKNMLTAVREKYPDAKIVWVYGMMSLELEDYIKPVVKEYAETDANVFYCQLPSNTSGGGHHPTEDGHTAAAEVLVDFINNTVLAK